MPSSVQLYSQAITDFKRLQSTILKTQQQIGAESKASTFAEMGDDTTNIQYYKFVMNRSDRFITTIADGERKNNLIEFSLGQIIDQIDKFKESLMIENSGSNAAVNDLSGQANSVLDNIRAALNAKDANNYLFAGSKTNTEPVADLKANSNYIAGQPTANYYQGDGYKAAIDVSSTQRVEYGITASDPAFQKLITALNLAKTEERSGNADYTEAGRLLDEAMEEIRTLRAKAGDNARILESNTEYHERTKLTFETNYSELNEPDVVELTIKAAQDQATLTASFQLFSRVSGLSLINFL